MVKFKKEFIKKDEYEKDHFLVSCNRMGIIIFIMSSMDTNESNGSSKQVINNVVEKTFETTNGLGITDKHLNEKMKQIIENLNKPLRMSAHASEYFIFIILILIKNSDVTGKSIL